MAIERKPEGFLSFATDCQRTPVLAMRELAFFDSLRRGVTIGHTSSSFNHSINSTRGSLPVSQASFFSLACSLHA